MQRAYVIGLGLGLALALGLGLGGCGDSVGPRPLHFELGTCGVVDIVPQEGALHVPQGTVIEWSTNPPTSGDHFAIWAAYDRSYGALDRGFWVHNLEHGAIVFAYKCDPACPDDVAALEDVVRSLPVDASCVDPVRQRAIVVEDPLLPDGVTFAAVAWGAMYTATCVDPDALREFARDFYDSAPEDLCDDGASLGGTFIE